MVGWQRVLGPGCRWNTQPSPVYGIERTEIAGREQTSALQVLLQQRSLKRVKAQETGTGLRAAEGHLSCQNGLTQYRNYCS
jgi:hypothetical protein